MKKLTSIFVFIFSFLSLNAQVQQLDKLKIREDLENIIKDLSRNYIYLSEKQVDLNCIKTYYSSQIEQLKTEEESVLLFEYLLDEFYDSHLILNTNRKSSFRLFSPIYAIEENGSAVIKNVWQSQIENLEQNIVGAKIKKINGIPLSKTIDAFPTHCNDKNSAKVREWIINKLLAGRYNQPRILTLELSNGKSIEFDLDKIKYKKDNGLLSFENRGSIGIISINNSLGNNSLVSEFDKALDSLMSTKAIIIDLRNTVDGGNSYVARGIMSRFITNSMPYQKHWQQEKYGDNPAVERSWLEYVIPRGKTYKNPVLLIVGRWTGSMAEGLAIGFEGMKRARIVGTEMERLSGEMNGFSFKHQNFGYRLSVAKLFHINGTPREAYVPLHYVKQSTMVKDETMEAALRLINE